MISLLICGKGGQGVETAGRLLASLCASNGWYVFGYNEIENSIHGGMNTYQITISNRRIEALSKQIDLVLVLDKETFNKNIDLLKNDCIVIYDELLYESQVVHQNNFRKCKLELKSIAKHFGLNNLLINTVGIGAMSFLLNFSKNQLTSCIQKYFENKSEEIIQNNIKASEQGYDACSTIYSKYHYNLKTGTTTISKLTTGNEVACKAAIDAKCEFIAAYPMTPSSNIFHGMVKSARTNSTIAIHAEDEIAAINMAIGAGYTGSRALTTTSGGGYALMTEAIGLAAMAEIPLVIIEVQRPGPATGLPTKTSQGDLRQVINAGQGYFPHIVLAPGNIEQIYSQIFLAFNYADIIQTPVTVLLDRYLVEQITNAVEITCTDIQINRGNILQYNEQPFFPRYTTMQDNLPIRSLPGQKFGIYVANSYEHDEYGLPTENPELIEQINRRRENKLITIQKMIPEARFIGLDTADHTIICWGSTLGVIRESLTFYDLRNKINILHFTNINPLPPNINDLILRIKHPIAIENNATGALCGWLAEKINLYITDKILDITGKPFTIEDLGEKIIKIIEKYA